MFIIYLRNPGHVFTGMIRIVRSPNNKYYKFLKNSPI